ncbi:MAG TPA: sulfite exporter TauE/SafE family protein [Gallionella sp.]|nr:sulfite exporter TauE/SafE family protein [Gallionella sp.]
MGDFLDPSLLPQQTTLFAVWLLGVSLGLTACTATCLPFMGTWVLGRGGTQRDALRDALLFAGGRIAAYAMLGAIAGGAGMWLSSMLRGGTGNVVIGLASIAAGLWLVRPAEEHKPCGVVRRAGSTPPMLLGFSLSLTPCAPLASLLAVCAAAGGVGVGMANGVAFGLGAALTPLLVLLPLICAFGARLRENRDWITRWIRWGAAAVLILLGLRRLFLGL